MLRLDASFARAALLGSTLALVALGCGDPPPVTPADGGTTDSGPPTCPTGTELCGTQCVDTDQSRANCGACGNACAAGEACVDGACDVTCPSSQTECDGACADTTRDRLHCGACGTPCAAGEACVDGSCELSCPAGQVACGATCVDTQSNAAHCGACDAACEAGAVCSAGACTTSCAPGTTQCGASCVDTQTNPDHCGACDADCAGAPGAAGLCVAGACRVACDALQGDCNADLSAASGDGCETPLSSDATNCGACGRSCSFPNAIGGCTTGSCSIGSCETGYDDCDGALENGCEAELATDPINCGACGTVCGAGEGCLSGACQLIQGEDCSDAVVLTPGMTTVHWTATANDYLPVRPSCTSSDVTGPDVVFSYTATVTEQVTFTISPPASTRWVTVAATGTCGATSAPVACGSEFGNPIVTSAIVSAGETIYFYVADTTSGANPLTNPLGVELTSVVVPCAPGVGGVLGTTVTRVPTGLGTSFTEYYVAADESPTGYAYVGGTSVLYRIPKAGGTVQDVAMAAGLTTDHLGYEMLIDGQNIYVINDATTGVSGRVWRISTDGGATWAIQDYAFFPTAPLDDIRSATVHGGRIYLVTEEDTSTVATQIWSIDAASATVPAIAVLETTIAGDTDCHAITRDASFYYLSCDDPGDRIIRVPVAGGATELVTSAIDINATSNSLHGDDLDADGVFDVLYAHGQYEDVSFVCSPDAAMPFGAALVDLGGASTNYGMGFDRTAGVLWTFDDDTREFVSVQ